MSSEYALHTVRRTLHTVYCTLYGVQMWAHSDSQFAIACGRWIHKFWIIRSLYKFLSKILNMPPDLLWTCELLCDDHSKNHRAVRALSRSCWSIPGICLLGVGCCASVRRNDERSLGFGPIWLRTKAFKAVLGDLSDRAPLETWLAVSLCGATLEHCRSHKPWTSHPPDETSPSKRIARISVRG